MRCVMNLGAVCPIVTAILGNRSRWPAVYSLLADQTASKTLTNLTPRWAIGTPGNSPIVANHINIKVKYI